MLAARDAAARAGAQQPTRQPGPRARPATLPRARRPLQRPPFLVRGDGASFVTRRPADADLPPLAAARGDGGPSASSSSSSISSSDDGGPFAWRRRGSRARGAAAAAAAAATAAPAAFAAPAVGAPPPMAPPSPAPPPLPERAAALADRLAALPDARARLAFLLKAAREASAAAASDAEQAATRRAALRARPEARVVGCASATFCAARMSADGASVEFDVDSDSELSLGLGAVLAAAMRGLSADEAAAFDASGFLGRAKLGAADAASAAAPEPEAAAAPSPPSAYTRDRADGAANLAAAMRRRAAALSPRGRALRDAFPSLVVSAEGLSPRGAFAEAQARYLSPDPSAVRRLGEVLREGRVGVVAHFYMDPEVQGALASVAAPGADGAPPLWPHVHISDSLMMADAAVRMAREGGCSSIAVLGVDFMSENVRAILDEAGFAHVGVYRLSPDRIGCSLAEAAEGGAYESFLERAASRAARDAEPALHVVYINTSLRTKARAHARVPTITCTSSNVVQTVLQAFAQEPRARVYYGPDTYMGRNLEALFRALVEGGSDEDVRALHPQHTVASVRALLPRLHHFGEGSCVVHHVFGGQVAEAVALGYAGDAYLTAHFEVPGEMFALAMEAKGRGAGVVGSTSNILDFIAGKVAQALREAGGGAAGGGAAGGGAAAAAPSASAASATTKQRVRFVLGTEAGMITSIVRRVQSLLRAAPPAARDAVEVEVVFPVATGDAITTEATAAAGGGAAAAAAAAAAGGKLLPEGLAVVPGPAGGEGCSLEGGCAACPYMRMNTLDALVRVASAAGAAARGDAGARAMLAPYRPAAYAESMALPPGAGAPSSSPSSSLSEQRQEDAGASGPVSVARAGCVPILHMRAFGQQKRLPDELLRDMRARFGAPA
jgi:quinolinate synthase